MDYMNTFVLRLIYSFLIGLMITAFIGVGVSTFFNPPSFTEEWDQLFMEEQTLLGSHTIGEWSPDDMQKIEEIGLRKDELSKKEQLARISWEKWTSILHILIATLTMSLSLVKVDKMSLFTQGLLLGGTLTMIYGVAQAVMITSGITRFLLITGALILTLLMGYFCFVRQKEVVITGTEDTELVETEDLTGLERRMRSIERRIIQAAHVLGHKS